MSALSTAGSWRQRVFDSFTEEIAAVARLTVVADPDELLAEQGVLEGLHARGFELIPFRDPVAFRYAYETRFRQVWDRGEPTNLVVVLWTSGSEVDALPFDLLAEARRTSRCLTFRLLDLFPNLSPKVVAELERSDLEALFEAQRVQDPEPLGENATRDFVLRHVFKVAPELVNGPVDLMRLLLRRHYTGTHWPGALDERFVRLLRDRSGWNDWPLEQIVPSSAAFFAFLQERWPAYVRGKVTGPRPGVAEPDAPYGLGFPGPVDLPFDHDDVRVYIDNLFLDGHLRPTTCVSKSRAKGAWFEVGVAGSEAADRVERLQKLLTKLAGEVPALSDDAQVWLQGGLRWAEAAALRWALPSGTAQEQVHRFDELREQMQEAFDAWLSQHYGSLYNLAYWPRPVMVHQVPDFLAHGMAGAPASPRHKVALVVVDGLALDQWILARDELQKATALTLEEGAVFAWIPTITSVSRQAIFAGNMPFYFGASLGHNQKEEHHWGRFWEEHGLRASDTGFVWQKSNEADGAFLARVQERAGAPRCKALGVVVAKVDEMVHGTVTGTGGLHATLRQWLETGALGTLLTWLVENGFAVCVTADHGNVEARGVGRPKAGDLPEQRGARVLVFGDKVLRDQVAGEVPGSNPWPSIGLPEDGYFPLLARGRAAFVPPGHVTVTHGGTSFEEVLVPFVRIGRKS